MQINDLRGPPLVGTRYAQTRHTRAYGVPQMGYAHHAAEEQEFELRYQSLFNEGRGYAFPCDADGHVNLDSLSDRKRESYLYVRALVGRDFSMPALRVNATG
jgi:hypothetical protein